MPATITHAVFSKDIYDILSEEIQSKIDLNRVKMFSQGVDSLMFYNLFSLAPGKNIRAFQKYFHNNNTQDFFINLINYIKNNRIKDKDVYSFLTGFICHYALDSTIHPYVIYKTGIFDKRKKDTYKYNNIHAFMETFIDNDIVIRRFRKNPLYFDFINYCFDTKHLSRDLNGVIDYTFYKTYKIRNMSEIYYKSLKQMKVALKLFRKDTYGVKKNIYKFIDTFTPKSVYRFEAISYNYPFEDTHNFLNSDNSVWHHPCIYDKTSTQSFVDLYLDALRLAKKLIIDTFDYIDGKDINLEDIFDNRSYITGLDYNDKKELKFFEF